MSCIYINKKKYFIGKGLDVSKEKVIAEADHFYKEPDNLYRISEKHNDLEGFDYIYANNIINSTKYSDILLKEWFYFLKPNGYLVIEFIDNKLLSLYHLIERTHVLFKGDVKIIEWIFKSSLEKNIEERVKTNLLVIQKTKSIVSKEDHITRWTFGISTNGNREDLVKKFIESVRKQKIPEYEIIICGTYSDRNENDIIYIPFSEKDNLGWITKKKNIICENASYQNIMIVHDRIVLNEGWFEGMKKYGNNFEVLGCIQLTQDGRRAGDWSTSGYKFRTYHKVGQLDYSDWDKWTFLGGQLFIIKKRVWENIKLNENLFWGDYEDMDFSFSLALNGFITRFNPYSIVTTLVWQHGNLPYYTKNTQKLGRLSGVPVRRFSGFLVYLLDRVVNLRYLKQSFVRLSRKSWFVAKIEKFIMNH